MKLIKIAAHLAGASILALSVSAHAQSNQASSGAPDQPAAESSDQFEEIVVTGSLISKAGFEAPTPVTVANSEDLARLRPTSIADGLNALPSFQGSISNAQDRNQTSGRIRTGNYLNLRSLGPQRVLTLQDGMRLPPSGNAGGTDANLIPQMLVQRVEVVTGGASAAYGSDAVSGVVNFIIDKKFEGVKLLAQGGLSERGDNGSYRFGIAAGTMLADDRLHIQASAEHFHSDGIPDRSTRPGMKDIWVFAGQGTAANPFTFINGVRYSNVAPGGYISSGPSTLVGKQFLTGGTLGTFTPGSPTGISNLTFGGQGITFPINQTLIASETTNQLFARADYEASDDVKIFVQGTYADASNRDTPISTARFTATSGTTIFAGNAFLTPDTTAALGSAPSFTVLRMFTDLPSDDSEQKTRAFIFQTGIEGKINSNLDWKLGYSFGQTKFSSSQLDLYLPRYYAAADAVRDPSGNIVCRVTLTNPGAMPGCVPLNIMGLGSPSQAAINYVQQQNIWRTRNIMHSVTARVSGDAFSLWAGPVSFAIGGEYRHQSLVQTSASNPGILPDYTGIRGVPNGSLWFGLNNVPVADGSYNIKELFGEVVVPLAKDSAIGRSLDLNGAFRYTHYSTSGSVETWKIGATYEPFDGVKFRGVVSRDIRAPTLYELFSGAIISPQQFNDPLTGVNAQYNQIASGNPDLKPEIGTTYTAGIVLQPDFAPGLSFSVDYYDIAVEGAIAQQYSAPQVLSLCAASNYTSPLCAQIDRPLGPTNTSPANFPSSVRVSATNVGVLKTKGLDIELAYRRTFGENELSFRALGSRLISFNVQANPTAAVVQYAGTADLPDPGGAPFPLPKWRANFDLGLKRGPFALNVTERIIGSFDRSHLFVYTQNRVPTVAYTDLTGSVDFELGEATATAFLTVNNLFDKTYPIVPVSQLPGLTLPTFRSVYDVIGRNFTLGIRAKF